MTPTYCYAVLRQPSRDGQDPGVIEEGWFLEEHGFVVLTDRDGNKVPGENNKRKIADGQTAKYVAQHLLKARVSRRPAKPFNRVLRYPVMRF
jgi:hypothetical protein